MNGPPELNIDDQESVRIYSLQEIQERFSLLDFLDSVGMGAYIVDKNRKILYWNQRAAEITGFTPEEVTGTKCQDQLLKHEDRMGINICPNELCPLARSMRTARTYRIPHTIFAHSKENKKIPLNVITFPLMHNDEVIGGVELFEPATPLSPDMAMAMTIQRLLIPSRKPDNVEVFYYPADYIGGDLIMITEDWACIADVSGHGVSSALISSGLRVILGEVLTPDLKIKDLGDVLEERFREFGNIDMFFTGIFLKQVKGGVEIVSFGHPAPVKISADSAEILDIHYDVLIGWGKKHSSVYRFEPLFEGESILLYSDGLTEITSGGEFLGEKGVLEILKNTSNPKDIYITAMEKSDENSHKDDISLVVVSYDGSRR